MRVLRVAAAVLFGGVVLPCPGWADCGELGRFSFSPLAQAGAQVCGAPAVAAAAGLVLVADGDVTPGVSNCLGRACLFSLAEGALVNQWALVPQGRADNPLAAHAPPVLSDLTALASLVARHRFEPMARLWPTASVPGAAASTRIFEQGERRYRFVKLDEGGAELSIEVAGERMKVHRFREIELHCTDPQSGAVRPRPQQPGSVELWGLPRIPAVVALATYYGEDLSCSRFDWVTIAWREEAGR